MELKIRTFSQLSCGELYGILKARQDIFIIEQDCIYPDMDDVDPMATHVFYKEGIDICAYARIYWEETEDNTVKIGRVLTVRRGQGLGLKVMREAVVFARDYYRPGKIMIHAQEQAKGFYEKIGFLVDSDPFMEDDIPHVRMILEEKDKIS